MAQWQTVLDIKDIWQKLNDGELGVDEGGKQIAERIKKLIPSIKTRFPLEVDELESCAEDFGMIDEGDVDGFDCALDRLYDWGDTSLDNTFVGKKLCWIKTSF